ncbi:MAG: hypothetical protein JJU11_18305 [Candidatus Sumerlaeia bacterium]|nr:hypothetical protein [Candidatus Sumerlaeia bacterium]
MKLSIQSGMKNFRQRLGAIMVVLGLSVCHPPTIQSHGLELSVQQLRDTDPAGLVGEQMLTVGEVKTLLAIRSARYRPGANLIYGLDDLVDQIHYFPAYDQYARKATESGMKLDPGEEELLDRESANFARLVFFQREIASRVPNPTLEMLTSLYEETRDTYFRTPEMFLVQKVVLDADGDITAKNSQDVLDRVAYRINAGETVAGVLREHGLTPRSIAIYPEGEENRELIEALREIEDRKALPPQMEGESHVLYYRRLHRPAGHVPLPSSIDALGELFRYREQERLIAEYLGGIGRNTDLVRVVEVNLLAEASLALEDDALLVIGDDIVTRGELRSALGWRLESIGLLDEEKFLEMALSTGVVQHRLMDHLLEEKQISQRHEVLFHREQFRQTLLARKILEEEALKLPPDVSDEEAIEQWRIERSSAGRIPGEVGYSLITLKAAPGETRWRDAFNRASSVPDFRVVANELMREDPDAMWVTGLVAHVSEFPRRVVDVVEGGKFPAVCVVRVEDKLRVYHVLQARPDESPGEGELERARAMITKYKLQNRIEELLVNTSVDVNVQILLPINDY